MNGWVLLRWVPRGIDFGWYLHSIGGTALNLCAGSGSFIEAAMNTGRSCLAVELDGIESS